MPRVLICDDLEAPGLDLLRQAGIELDERTGLKGAPLQEAIRAAAAVIVRSATKITAAELDNPGKLRAIVRAGVGVDTIDVGAVKRSPGALQEVDQRPNSSTSVRAIDSRWRNKYSLQGQDGIQATAHNRFFCLL